MSYNFKKKQNMLKKDPKSKGMHSKIKKGIRAPDFVKIDQGKSETKLHFPMASHPIEKRLMAFYLIITIAGFGTYGYLKPDSAILTEGIIPYQLSAFFAGCFGLVKFTSLLASRVYIRIGKASIDLYYGRMAKRKLQRLHSQRLDQLYVEQEETLLGYKYNVKAITKNQKEHVMYSTYNSRLAKYIEFTLEDHLGIENRPVDGEFQGIKKTESDEYL